MTKSNFAANFTDILSDKKETERCKPKTKKIHRILRKNVIERQNGCQVKKLVAQTKRWKIYKEK